MHIDARTGRGGAMPDPAIELAAVMQEESRGSSNPPEVGRVIGIRSGRPR